MEVVVEEGKGGKLIVALSGHNDPIICFAFFFLSYNYFSSNKFVTHCPCGFCE